MLILYRSLFIFLIILLLESCAKGAFYKPNTTHPGLVMKRAPAGISGFLFRAINEKHAIGKFTLLLVGLMLLPIALSGCSFHQHVVLSEAGRYAEAGNCEAAQNLVNLAKESGPIDPKQHVLSIALVENCGDLHLFEPAGQAVDSCAVRHSQHCGDVGADAK